MIKRHILAVLLENESGALSRVVGLFSQRNYNIESLTVGTTQDPTLSRITLTAVCDDETVEQIEKQLNKLISVFKVVALSDQSHIERELAFIKVRCLDEQRSEIKRVVDIFNATIIDVTDTSYIIKIVAKSKTINALLRAINNKQILEVVRSGVSSISRGEKSISIN